MATEPTKELWIRAVLMYGSLLLTMGIGIALFYYEKISSLALLGLFVLWVLIVGASLYYLWRKEKKKEWQDYLNKMAKTISKGV